MSKLKAIAALAHNRVIGRDGTIPWHLPDELRWFKRITTGHAVLMGRKTYASLGRPLPNRQNIVVTRSADWEAGDGVTVLRTLDGFDPTQWLEPGRDLFVIGGAELYAALLPQCSELILTHVPLDVEGDTFFPEYESTFREVETLLVHPEFEARRYLRRA